MLTYVSGYPKSGTTLLQALLSTDPRCGPLTGESTFPMDVALSYGRHLAAWNDDSRYLFESKDQMREFFSGMLASYEAQVVGRYPPAKGLVLKHPKMTGLFPLLRRLRPDDRFVVIIRDPRDVMASYVQAAIKAGETIDEAAQRTMAEHLAQAWAEAYQRIAASDPPFVVVRYEDLVQDFDQVRAELEEEFGVALEPDPAAVWRRSVFDYLQGSDTPEQNFVSEDWGKPVTRRRIGIHEDCVPPSVRRLLERACGPIAEHFGYALRPSPTP
ncbi:MAG: sulfotransferase [Myxococcota bacterium]